MIVNQILAKMGVLVWTNTWGTFAHVKQDTLEITVNKVHYSCILFFFHLSLFAILNSLYEYVFECFMNT